MSEIRPTIEPAPEHRVRRRAASGRASLADVLELVARASRISDGFVLLERAPLECIAVLLGVDPRAVERVRAALEDPAVRDEALREVARAAGRRPEAPAPRAPPRPHDPEALLAAARARADGLTLLLSAAPEAAAIAFGVHPDLVHSARELAARGAAGA